MMKQYANARRLHREGRRWLRVLERDGESNWHAKEEFAAAKKLNPALYQWAVAVRDLASAMASQVHALKPDVKWKKVGSKAQSPILTLPGGQKLKGKLSTLTKAHKVTLWEATLGGLTIYWRKSTNAYMGTGALLTKNGKPLEVTEKGKPKWEHASVRKDAGIILRYTVVKQAQAKYIAQLRELGKALDPYNADLEAKWKAYKSKKVSAPSPGYGPDDVVYVKVAGGKRNEFYVGKDSSGRSKYKLVPPDGKSAKTVAWNIKSQAHGGKKKLFGGQLYVIRYGRGKKEYEFYKVPDFYKAK